MAALMNIGFGNVVNIDKIVAVIQPDSAPTKRMIQESQRRRVRGGCNPGKTYPCGDYYQRRIYRSFCVTAGYTDWQI